MEKTVTKSPRVQGIMDSFRKQSGPNDPSTALSCRCAANRIAILCLDLTIYWKEFPEDFKDEVRQTWKVDDRNPNDIIIAAVL